MELSKKETDKLKGLVNRLKAAEQAVKDLEVERREALADVFEAEDNGRDPAKLRKTATTLKNRLEDSRLKIKHCDGKLKDAISAIVDQYAKKAPAALEDVEKARLDLMRECGESLARVQHILLALGAEFADQRIRIGNLWNAHFVNEEVTQGAIIRKAFAETTGEGIRKVDSERQELKHLSGAPERFKVRLYGQVLRETL
jgi:hypothetical protein